MDARSRKLAVVAHCLLNQNAKVAGLAGYPGVFLPLANMLCDKEVGIIQLPCPELEHLGPNRPLGTDTREQYETPEYRHTCRRLAARVVSQLSAYRSAGYCVACVLGVEGSPSCSVLHVPRLDGNRERVILPGKGVFMEILSSELETANLEVPMIGIPENELAGNLQRALARVAKLVSEKCRGQTP